MANNTATVPDLFGETLTEVEQLVDLWSALADTKGYERLLKAELRVLKLRTPKLPDSIRLQVEYCDRLVAIRVKSEPIGQYASSEMDEILLSLINAAMSFFAVHQGELVYGLQKLAAWKRELSGIRDWNMDGHIWDGWAHPFVNKLIQKMEQNLIE